MNEDIARDAKDKLGFESYSTDWHDIINDPSIAVVDICTPNNAHADIAIAAAEAGKHIICEKPLALTSEQARRMYLAAKKNNVKTMVAFNYRKTPAVQLAKNISTKAPSGKSLIFAALICKLVRGSGISSLLAVPESSMRKRRSWRYRNPRGGHAPFPCRRF